MKLLVAKEKVKLVYQEMDKTSTPLGLTLVTLYTFNYICVLYSIRNVKK